MKIHYIFHSGFVVETDEAILVFDYWRDPAGVMERLAGKKKRAYVFSSHFHEDHFTKDIFKWREDNPFTDYIYILSKDIRLGHNYLARNGYSDEIKKKITFVTFDKKYKVDDLNIYTLRSNDAGVAFTVEVDGLKLYHAGDLNWWNTEGRGELYGEQYGREYKRALRHIENQHFDLGFVVLDPRLGEDGYFLGLDYFIKNIDCTHIFPMHMWGDYTFIKRFKDRPDIANLRDRIVDIDQENMIFEIED